MKNITIKEVFKAIEENGSKVNAAKALGIARSTLYKLLEEFNNKSNIITDGKTYTTKLNAKATKLSKLPSKSIDKESKNQTILPSSFIGELQKNNSRSHFIISDMQVTPSNLTQAKRTLHKIAMKVLEKKPNVLIFLGDFADMESLYRASKKYDQFDSKKFKADVRASNEAMDYFQNLIKNLKVEQHITVGNHEDRINKFIENNIQISALISFDELNYNKYMKVHKYLEVATIDGIQYSHKFVNGSGGADITSARALLKKTYGHACQGHSRKIDQFTDYKPNGEQLSTLLAGASYEHEMSYLNNPQDRLYPRQVWFCQDVNLGFNVERIDLPSLPDNSGL